MIFICNLKNNTNECVCKTETACESVSVTEHKLVVIKGEREGQMRGMGLTDTNYYT